MRSCTRACQMGAGALYTCPPMKRDETLWEPKPGQWMTDDDFGRVVRLTPLVSIDLIVRGPEGRVLLGRRKNEPARGYLFVPGGRISKNETRAAAFRRLTREELGVERRLEEARLLGTYDHIYPTNRLRLPGFGTHYVVLGYEILLPLDLMSLPLVQHGEYFWMTDAEALASPEVHDNTKAYLRAPTPV
jgi:colanic acid biosynthesis protein WcaH